jgi:hypothetical protein
MQRYRSGIFLVFILILTGIGCRSTRKEAAAYNDQLVILHTKFSIAAHAFFDQVAAGNSDSIQKSYERLQSASADATKQCQSLQPFEGKRDYLDVSIQFFVRMQEMTENNCRMIATTMTQPGDSLSEEERTLTLALMNAFDQKYNAEFEKVKTAQKAFSENWHFDLK